MRVGYRRVSSVDQSLARQDLGDCERVFEEKLSGSSANRPALQEMIAFVRTDDEVYYYFGQEDDDVGYNIGERPKIEGEAYDSGPLNGSRRQMPSYPSWHAPTP